VDPNDNRPGADVRQAGYSCFALTTRRSWTPKGVARFASSPAADLPCDRRNAQQRSHAEQHGTPFFGHDDYPLTACSAAIACGIDAFVRVDIDQDFQLQNADHDLGADKFAGTPVKEDGGI
jgi:hypothetical protein